MNLILLEPSELRDDGTVRVADARARHMLTVLDVAPGREVRVGLVDGPFGVGTVIAHDDEGVLLRCAFAGEPPPMPWVDVLLAVPRPKVMRRLWAQLSALGVGRIILTSAARVERFYFDSHVLAPESYRPLLVEGLQQARDTRLPRVSIHRSFRILVEDELDARSDASLRVVADPEHRTPLTDVVREHAPDRLLVAIGPEGGWNAFELELLGARGFRGVGLGPRTLRTDTACVSVLALAHDALRYSGRRNRPT